MTKNSINISCLIKRLLNGSPKNKNYGRDSNQTITVHVLNADIKSAERFQPAWAIQSNDLLARGTWYRRKRIDALFAEAYFRGHRLIHTRDARSADPHSSVRGIFAWYSHFHLY